MGAISKTKMLIGALDGLEGAATVPSPAIALAPLMPGPHLKS